MEQIKLDRDERYKGRFLKNGNKRYCSTKGRVFFSI
jgi:hypothetical protein